jgi:hypothetical protein
MGWWFWRCYSPDKKREGIINRTLGFHGRNNLIIILTRI